MNVYQDTPTSPQARLFNNTWACFKINESRQPEHLNPE